jgi:hypothetical protein
VLVSLHAEASCVLRRTPLMFCAAAKRPQRAQRSSRSAPSPGRRWPLWPASPALLHRRRRTRSCLITWRASWTCGWPAGPADMPQTSRGGLCSRTLCPSLFCRCAVGPRCCHGGWLRRRVWNVRSHAAARRKCIRWASSNRLPLVGASCAAIRQLSSGKVVAIHHDYAMPKRARASHHVFNG